MNCFTSFYEFSKMVNLSRQDICLEVLEEHRQNIKIKKEKTIVKNLVRIFDAALKISNEKGFQAMSMRKLSQETRLSIGALYAYFSGKEELLEMLQNTGHSITWRILGECLKEEQDPVARLRTAIQAHLFLTEVMQPWFYFSYMEAKNLSPEQREKAKAGELETERLFVQIIEEGRADGSFIVSDSRLLASVIKAMVQDWYVKRWKYAKRNVTVDQYARFLIDFVESFCLASGLRRRTAWKGYEDGLYGPTGTDQERRRA